MTRIGRQLLTLAWIAVALPSLACFRMAPPAPEPEPEPVVVHTPPDLDSLAVTLATIADSATVDALPDLELEVRRWLERLEFEDRELLPRGADGERFFRTYRGRLLDTLGWAALRRGDVIQAEAALVSARSEINSRGVVDGFADHFLHLGRLFVDERRWDEAIEALIDAEQRGAGSRATAMLEGAYRERHGSLRGLDGLREAERARIEDERLQILVAEPLRERMPEVAYPRRTGPPMTLPGGNDRPLVIAAWGSKCAECPGYSESLRPLAAALRRRGAGFVGVWLDDDPARAGPPQSYTIVVPTDVATARGELGVTDEPAFLIVDASDRIRYRWAGVDAAPPPIDDILVQVDHLRKRAETLRSTTN